MIDDLALNARQLRVAWESCECEQGGIRQWGRGVGEGIKLCLRDRRLTDWRVEILLWEGCFCFFLQFKGH